MPSTPKKNASGGSTSDAILEKTKTMPSPDTIRVAHAFMTEGGLAHVEEFKKGTNTPAIYLSALEENYYEAKDKIELLEKQIKIQGDLIKAQAALIEHLKEEKTQK